MVGDAYHTCHNIRPSAVLGFFWAPDVWLSSAPPVPQDCPEFDLVFDNASDQWVAGSAGEKCMFVQVLHHTCQRHSGERKPEFVNCQSKLLGGMTIRHLRHPCPGHAGVSALMSLTRNARGFHSVESGDAF